MNEPPGLFMRGAGDPVLTGESAAMPSKDSVTSFEVLHSGSSAIEETASRTVAEVGDIGMGSHPAADAISTVSIGSLAPAPPTPLEWSETISYQRNPGENPPVLSTYDHLEAHPGENPHWNGQQASRSTVVNSYEVNGSPQRLDVADLVDVSPSPQLPPAPPPSSVSTLSSVSTASSIPYDRMSASSIPYDQLSTTTAASATESELMSELDTRTASSIPVAVPIASVREVRQLYNTDTDSVSLASEAAPMEFRAPVPLASPQKKTPATIGYGVTEEPQTIAEAAKEDAAKQVPVSPLSGDGITSFPSERKDIESYGGRPSPFENVTNIFWETLKRIEKLPFYPYIVISFGVLFVLCTILPTILSGILIGLYMAHLVFLNTLSRTDEEKPPVTAGPLAPTAEYSVGQEALAATVDEELSEDTLTGRVFEGWMNIYNEPYHPFTFHVNNVQTVLVRLEGSLLHVSRPERALLKHAFQEDPTITEPPPKMLAHSVYDLTNATIALRPQRLAKRRWYVRKYPICIKLSSPEYETHERNHDLFIQTQEENAAILHDKKRNPIMKLFRRKKAKRTPMGDTGGLRRSASAEVLGDKARWSEELSEAEDEPTPGSHEPTSGGRAVRVKSMENMASNQPLATLRRNYPGTKTRASRNIYLFARSTREKEHWFHRLRRASTKYSSQYASLSSEMQAAAANFTPRVTMPVGNPGEHWVLDEQRSADGSVHVTNGLHGIAQLSKAGGNPVPRRPSPTGPDGAILMDIGRHSWQRPSKGMADQTVYLYNLMASRVIYDFARDPTFINIMRQKAQNKMAALHIPYFIESLELTHFDLGTAIPVVRKVFSPYTNDWGIWTDMEVEYEGSVNLTIETSVNLLKLKYNDSLEEHPGATQGKPGKVHAALPPSLRFIPSNYADEDKLQSPETSPDEDFGNKMRMAEPVSTKKKPAKKLLSLIDKVAHSKIFKELTEFDFVKDALEGIASSKIVVHAEVTYLHGVLAVNLPPPPSDRLWYGFRTPPEMTIKTSPEIAGSKVHLAALSDFIESKLRLMLSKNIVMPNMDDFVVPLFSGNDLLDPKLMVQ